MKPKGGFILHDHYAVVFRVLSHSFVPAPQRMILSEDAWKHLQELAKAGHFVILEAWNITQGKCVSN